MTEFKEIDKLVESKLDKNLKDFEKLNAILDILYLYYQGEPDMNKTNEYIDYYEQNNNEWFHV